MFEDGQAGNLSGRDPPKIQSYVKLEIPHPKIRTWNVRYFDSVTETNNVKIKDLQHKIDQLFSMTMAIWPMFDQV